MRDGRDEEREKMCCKSHVNILCFYLSLPNPALTTTTTTTKVKQVGGDRYPVKDVVPVEHDVTVLAGQVLGGRTLGKKHELAVALLDPLEALLVRVDPRVLSRHFVPQVLQGAVATLPEGLLGGPEGQRPHGDLVRLHQILVAPANCSRDKFTHEHTGVLCSLIQI